MKHIKDCEQCHKVESECLLNNPNHECPATMVHNSKAYNEYYDHTPHNGDTEYHTASDHIA